MVNYKFTFEEKKKVLENKGFRIEKHPLEEHEWDHNYCEVVTNHYWFALKGEITPSEHNKLDVMFDFLVYSKFADEKQKFLDSL